MSSLLKTPGVYVEPNTDRFAALESVETGVAAFLGVAGRGPAQIPVRIHSFDQFARTFGADYSVLSLSMNGFFENGGKCATVVNVNEYGGTRSHSYLGTQGTAPRGLQLLETIDDIDLVVLPSLGEQDRKHSFLLSRSEMSAVQGATIAHCERLQTRFALLDSLPGMTSTDASKHRAQFDSSFAAFFHPWIRSRVGAVASPALPPSGHIAGLFAKVDRREGVHRSAANTALEGVVDVTEQLQKSARDQLFAAQINGLFSFAGRGVRVGGSRTLCSDSPFAQINVRRLFILLRKSIERYAQWVVFEPNEPALWKKLTRTIDSFLHEMWKRGAFVGGAAEEAYYVKCDEETNPLEARDAGQLTLEIGVAPVRPAEFIVVRIQQWTREASGEPDEETAAPARATGPS